MNVQIRILVLQTIELTQQSIWPQQMELHQTVIHRSELQLAESNVKHLPIDPARKKKNTW